MAHIETASEEFKPMEFLLFADESGSSRVGLGPFPSTLLSPQIAMGTIFARPI